MVSSSQSLNLANFMTQPPLISYLAVNHVRWIMCELLPSGCLHENATNSDWSMNLYRYEIFALFYMKPGRNDIYYLLPNTGKCIADPKAYRLEISGPSLRFVVIYMRTVRTQFLFLVKQLRQSQTKVYSVAMAT